MSIHNTEDRFSVKAGSGGLGKIDEDAADHVTLVSRPPASNHICTIVFKVSRSFQ